MAAPAQVPAPPQAFPGWLAQALSAGGLRCRKLVFRADGRLVITMGPAMQPTRVLWALWDDDPRGRPFRGGSLRGSDPRKVLQVAAQLDRLYAQWHLPLLSGIPGRDEPLQLTAQALGQRLELLLPPETRVCGSYRYQGCQEAGLHRPSLLFASGDKQLVFTLMARGFSAGQPIIADIGPTSLSMATIPSDPEQRELAGLVGFWLHLCVGRPTRLQLNDPAAPSSDGGRHSMLDERYQDELAVFDTLSSSAGVGFVGGLERECLHCLPSLSVLPPGADRSPLSPAPQARFSHGLRFVDPSEDDAIMQSAEEALPPLLHEVAMTQAPDVLVVIDSCLSRIKGDATAEVLREQQPDLGIPTIYLDGSVAELHNYSQLWRQLLACFAQAAPRSEQPSVNLIGFGLPGTAAEAELTSLLSDAGIAVNLNILPAFDSKTLGRFNRAWADVLCPSHQARDGTADLPERPGAPLIAPPAPCGPRHCRSWLDALRTACGLPPLDDSHFAALIQDHAPGWASLCERAASRGVGIVFERRDLLGGVPRLRWGIPWLEALEEMGFNLSFALYESGDGLAEPFDLARLLPFLQQPTRHAQAHLTDLSALADASFELVYTERFRDSRITRAGKLPFSISSFELGLAGACRSLERLLGLGAVTFHRDHAPRPPQRQA